MSEQADGHSPQNEPIELGEGEGKDSTPPPLTWDEASRWACTDG